MFEIGRSVVIDVTGFGLPNVASSSFRSFNFSSLLEDVVESVSKLFTKSEQEYGLVTAENWQLELLEQVPQSFGRQTEEVLEESRGLRGGPTKLIVKQSGGFGPATIRLETNRHTPYFGTTHPSFRNKRRACGKIVSGSISGMVTREDRMRGPTKTILARKSEAYRSREAASILSRTYINVGNRKDEKKVGISLEFVTREEEFRLIPISQGNLRYSGGKYIRNRKSDRSSVIDQAGNIQEEDEGG